METKLMEVNNMAKQVAHPKQVKFCVFCKRWNGNADLEFKSPTAGFQFTTGVPGKCMATNGVIGSTGNNTSNCKRYEPSVEASRLL